MPPHPDSLDELAVTTFREYLRIPSVQPDVDYDPCVAFLKAQAQSLDLPLRVIRNYPDKPIVVITWTGKNPTLPTILLNSHMDVVPVFEDKWTRPPFGAEEDAEGNIYARGAQDMKCVGIQYLEAVRRLRKQKKSFSRTIHILFVPDEEIGGKLGMREFVHTQEFKDLNVGFSLDEGLACPTEDYVVFNGERTIWQMKIHCTGQPGHGSLLLENTAGEKVCYILSKFSELRQREAKKLRDDPSLTIGDVTTVNLTQLQGGVQTNVIPPEMMIVVDCRIPVTVNIEQFEKTLNQWCKEAGEGVWIDFEQKQCQIPVTKLDQSNPFWIAFKAAADQLKINLKTQIFTGGTDSRFVRGVGLPALGFSPMNNTPILLHDNDEFLNRKVFLRGIEIYCEIIPAIADVQ